MEPHLLLWKTNIRHLIITMSSLSWGTRNFNIVYYNKPWTGKNGKRSIESIIGERYHAGNTFTKQIKIKTGRKNNGHMYPNYIRVTITYSITTIMCIRNIIVNMKPKINYVGMKTCTSIMHLYHGHYQAHQKQVTYVIIMWSRTLEFQSYARSVWLITSEIQSYCLHQNMHWPHCFCNIDNPWKYNYINTKTKSSVDLVLPQSSSCICFLGNSSLKQRKQNQINICRRNLWVEDSYNSETEQGRYVVDCTI